MKIRIDFVTNSSSSSFILGVKGELTKDKILNALKVPKDSLLKKVADEFASVIYNRAKKFDMDEKMEDYGCDNPSELY